MTGKRLSHYEIVEEISRGGMGVVYRAVDVNLGREVAIKVLPDELVQDAGRRERLLLEARAASALEHPHIAVIHEVGDADGVTFLAMELIRGEKLSAVLSRGPLPQTRALSLAIEVAEGLARAHEKGIVHRDLKPANVMITDDGHAKVIDFGLVKLLEPVGDDAATASVGAPRTEAGLVLGTAAYMSPEQARGARVDHRSDVFALGVMLYEMLTGRPAFHGQSSLDTMQAILTQPVPPLPAAADSSAEVTTELQRIIGKATAKDPDDRFQGMKDLVVDLRAARRRLESAPAPAVATPGSGAYPPPPAGRGDHSRIVLAVAAALAMVVAVGALLWWQTRRPEPRAASASGKPAVAVLYFENNTGDESLDWMRTGLTDMLVTDLSQSPEFEVVGTDRLVQILQDLGRIDDRVLSAEVVQEIAHRAAVDNVLVGSYVKAGGAIRISARLQDAQTGRIVSAEKVEGTGEASLFGLVDELTRRFRERIAAASAPLVQRPGAAPLQAGLDREVTEVTTSSIEAWRYYAEGINFHERGLAAQAAPLLEKAIEIDPNFAMAYAKLAVVRHNLGAFDKRDEYAERALDLVGRLTTRERYYIEGFYFSHRPATLERAIDAYTQGLRLHPEHYAMRHNLASRGDSGTAATELSKASAMLPVHGSLWGWPPPHGDLWYAAAVANIGAGRDAEAARLLERLQSSHERWAAMEAWARSFYLLGGIYERRGESDRAREQYRQFVDLWRDGDLERAWLGAAERKLKS
jgi:TolB-like protein/predicted Ser/Thr protein kinase